jgi:SAM-dependent methyltransferase
VQRSRSFPEWLARLAGITGSSRVLDVGAGPLTVLGRNLPGDEHPVSVTACDPLANHYALLAKKYGVEPPIPTLTALAEDLSAFFPVDSFDLTFCRNALDHSFSPLRGIIEMLLVTRPGGKTVLHHHVNEAERGQYDGFHQWNFCLKHDRFHIWNEKTDIDVADVLSGFATTSGYVKDGFVTAVLERQGPSRRKAS